MRLRVTPHRSGRWLVAIGRRRYLASPELGRHLAAVEGTEAAMGGEVATVNNDQGRDDHEFVAPLPAVPARRAIWLRCPLVPARGVAALARTCAPLASWPVLISMAVVGVAGYLAGHLFGHLAGSAARRGVLGYVRTGATAPAIAKPRGCRV